MLYIFSKHNAECFCDHDLCDLTVKPLGLLQGIFVTKFFYKDHKNVLLQSLRLYINPVLYIRYSNVIILTTSNITEAIDLAFVDR